MHPQGIRRLGRRHVACGPCSLLPTCSSFSYPLGTLAGQTLPTDEYDASYRSAAHALSTGELPGTPLPRTRVNNVLAGLTQRFIEGLSSCFTIFYIGLMRR